MATVPALQGQRIVPGGADAPTLRGGAVPGAFGEGIAEGAQRLGMATEQYADALNEHRVVIQGIQNKADSDAAYIKGGDGMGDIATEFKTNVQGGNALPALKDYEDKMEQARVKAGEGLNPAAARLYEADSRRLYSGFRGQLISHAAEQNRKFTLDTSNAKMATAANTAAANPNDPTMLGLAHAVIQNETMFQAHYNGEGEDVAKQKLAERSSALYSSVITQKANDNPVAASRFYEEHRDEMTAADQQKMDSFLKQRSEPYVARQIVDDIFRGGSPEITAVKTIQADPKGFFSRKLGDGITINSTVRDAAHNAEVGGVAHSYHIASNGYAVDIGPGTSGKTVAQLAADLKKAGLGATEIVPEPGKNHVHIGWSKDALAARATPGINLERAQTLPELDGMLLPGLHAVDAAVEHVYGNDPHIKDMAETEFKSRFNTIRMAISGRTIEANDNVIATLNADPQHPPTSLEALQRDPSFQTSWQYLSAAQQKGVMAQLKRNANPTINSFTASQMGAFEQLDGESKASPAKFAQRDPLSDPLYAELPNTYKAEFLKRRNTINAGQVVDRMTVQALRTVVPLLKGTDYENNAENADNYNKFASQLSQSVQAYYTNHKKEPSPVETREMAQDLLLKSGGFFSSAKNIDEPGYVPAWFRTEATAEAKARGVSLTPAMMSQLYQRRAARAQ